MIRPMDGSLSRAKSVINIVSWLQVTVMSPMDGSLSRAKSVINIVSLLQVTVMSPMDGSLSYAGQTSADSVQMNPSEPLIALKGKKEVFLIWGYIIKCS